MFIYACGASSLPPRYPLNAKSYNMAKSYHFSDKLK
jgi:hypothetical protein